jgi:hypothetical protein
VALLSGYNLLDKRNLLLVLINITINNVASIILCLYPVTPPAREVALVSNLTVYLYRHPSAWLGMSNMYSTLKYSQFLIKLYLPC